MLVYFPSLDSKFAFESGDLEPGVEDVACAIIFVDGSVPMIRLNWGESSREMGPCPQPRSRRVLLLLSFALDDWRGEEAW